MESKYTELAHYGTKNKCAGTDNDFSPISEVCNGTVSLSKGMQAVLLVCERMFFFSNAKQRNAFYFQIHMLPFPKFHWFSPSPGSFCLVQHIQKITKKMVILFFFGFYKRAKLFDQKLGIK